MKKYILLLLSVSCFGQFNPVQWYGFGGNSKINTYIGGIGGTINTRELLAAKLGINVNAIKKFTVVSSNVECSVIQEYVMPTGSWEGVSTGITSFNDSIGKCIGFDAHPFRNSNSSIVEVFFKGCTYIIRQSFRDSPSLKIVNMPALLNIFQHENFMNCTSLELVDIKRCTQIGDSVSDNGNFINIKAGCVINVNIFLATANSGLPDGDLVYAKNTRSAVVNFYDDDGNYVSTL